MITKFHRFILYHAVIHRLFQRLYIANLALNSNFAN